ncbi:MAG TPA: chorismate lyase [Methylophilaceae bacterium]|nr:chorismate lyase [Methylophilaceae bacterium]
MNSGAYRRWLVESGSLTRKLQRASEHFAVEQIRSAAARPLAEEARLMKLGPEQKALVREVLLCCNHKPAVFAHSVLPFASLQGSWRGLPRLGNKPLGAALFSDPLVRRTPLQFRKLSASNPLYQQARPYLQFGAEELWARRSLFFLGSSTILVTEVFLPQVLTL